MMKDANKKTLNKLLCAGVLCLILSACGAPVEPPTSTVAPTETCTATREPIPTLTHTAMSTPTCTPSAIPTDEPEHSPGLFHGCWQFETEDVMLDVQLEQQGSDVQGTLFLIKICVVAGERSACRIREGFIEGTATTNEMEIRLTIPEYDDEGTALLTLADDGETLSWGELEYPEVGLGDAGPHYLPPKFTLIPCE